jgi:DNA polymerase-3 subunit delta'
VKGKTAAEAFTQSPIIRVFGRILRRGRLGHAYLLAGPSGIGRDRLALFLASLLLCDKPDVMSDLPRPCGTCTGCRKVEHGSHPDLVVVRPDGAMIKIHQIRELRKSLSFSPLEAERRVCVILEAHRMNPDASNALLKTLEEPPEGTHLFLTASSTGALLPTVVSRCLVQRCRALPCAMLEGLIRDREPLPEGSGAFLASMAQGSLSTAVDLVEQGIFSLRDAFLDFAAKTAGDAVPFFFVLSKEMAGDQQRLLLFTKVIRAVTRDLMALADDTGPQQEGPDAAASWRLINSDRRQELVRLASSYMRDDLANYSAWLERFEGLLERNVNRDMLAESALVFWIRKRREHTSGNV